MEYGTVLKYTLGALAAALILIFAGGVILLQVTDGGANQGAAPLTIVSASDSEVWPLDFQVKEDQIIELRFDNKSSATRTLRLVSDDVEQLQEAPTHNGPVRPPPDGIYIEAPPGLGSAAYVRFKKPGEYALKVAFTGTYFPGPEIRVIVR